MKQIVQNLKNGATSLEEVPAPSVRKGHLLIQSTFSLLSPGTEKMLLEFGKANWLNKARQQPERVKQVWNKISTDGLRPAVKSILSKLDRPVPMGYSNAGVVLEVGDGVTGFSVGDRVVSNGPHAEIICVPEQLTAKIPANVTDQDACFTVLGAVALQGIRLTEPSFGETVVVAGLGLLGQLTVQLLRANGCRVIAMDTNNERCRLADQAGVTTYCNTDIHETLQFVSAHTEGRGVDAVIITASSANSDLITLAAKACRKRGRVTLVGVTQLHLDRSDFYEKEIRFQVSCSYGPGRYDYNFEEKAMDYPIGFVRWTARRNFEAVLDALASGQLNVKKLLTDTRPLSDFRQVYDNLLNHAGLAISFSYPEITDKSRTIHFHSSSISAGPTSGAIGIVGAGNYVTAQVLPALKQHKFHIAAIASEKGLSAALAAKKYGIPTATSDHTSILNNPDITTVIIATRHDTHARLATEALLAGKNVFVEKPLALTVDELDQISLVSAQSRNMLMVGYNRRFAPIAAKTKSLLLPNCPLNIVMTVNAGVLPKQHWLNDIDASGGRIIGEACHFIDLCSYFTGSEVTAVVANAMDSQSGKAAENVSILLQYADGSNATIHYFSNGSTKFEKEHIQIFQAGHVLIIENWKRLTGYGFSNFTKMETAQDKGQHNQFGAVKQLLEKGGTTLVAISSLLNTSHAAIAATTSLTSGTWQKINRYNS